jgi:purine-nucleoside/S-methyl-5'-thioadenosine phosphorylase / adenosine deaminase
VAIVHAGWRGAAQQIAVRAVDDMASRFGTRPESLSAAIGPGIGACCYEVGPEVSARFGREGRVRLDLAAEIASQLRTAGLSPQQIFWGSFCTFCQKDEFWSYRREGERAGRMWSAARVKPI